MLKIPMCECLNVGDYTNVCALVAINMYYELHTEKTNKERRTVQCDLCINLKDNIRYVM